MSDKPHRWVIATTLEISEAVAVTAYEREHVVLSSVRAEVLDLYCDHCRRTFEQARGTGCALGPQHSGGPRRQPDLGPLPPEPPAPPALATPPAELSLFDA